MISQSVSLVCDIYLYWKECIYQEFRACGESQLLQGLEVEDGK